MSGLPGEVSPGPAEGPVLRVVSAQYGVHIGSHPVVEVVRDVGWLSVTSRRNVARIVGRCCHPHHLRGVGLDDLVQHTPASPGVDRNKVS